MCSSILIFCTFCWISTITSDRQVKLSFVFFVVLVDQCVCWNLENTLCGTRVGLSLGITEHLVMWVFPFPPLDLSGVLLQSVTLISWNALIFFSYFITHTEYNCILFVYLFHVLCIVWGYLVADAGVLSVSLLFFILVLSATFIFLFLWFLLSFANLTFTPCLLHHNIHTDNNINNKIK